MSSEVEVSRFDELGLPAPLMRALGEVGYETPSAIQAMTIPHLLAGRDLLGQAQTGTGKTAAFALPLLARLELARLPPQVLVLAPTRELAIQVAEAFQRYAAYLEGFQVLPIYGGQGLPHPAARPAAQATGDRGHTGSCHGPHETGFPVTGRPALPGAR